MNQFDSWEPYDFSLKIFMPSIDDELVHRSCKYVTAISVLSLQEVQNSCSQVRCSGESGEEIKSKLFDAFL